MHKIEEGLFLGNLDAANDTTTLKKNGINHILTVAYAMEPLNSSVAYYLYSLTIIIEFCMEEDRDLRYAYS